MKLVVTLYKREQKDPNKFKSLFQLFQFRMHLDTAYLAKNTVAK